MRFVNGLRAVAGLAAVSVLGSTTVMAAGRSSIQLDTKFNAGMPQVLRAAKSTDLLPINIILTEQADRGRIDATQTLPTRDQRFNAVKAILTEVATRTQAPILSYLREGQVSGKVGSRLETLWISNVISTDATREVIYALAARSDVAIISSNAKVKLFPDPKKSDEVRTQAVECGVNVMKAPQVWNMGITGQGVVVAMIDTGVCYTHPDLINQIWANPGEIPGNGVDDDGNGFKDDVRGWNFDTNNNNPNDSNGHGTHTAGTVGGDGTKGTQTGMAPDVALMVLRVGVTFSDENDVWQAMQYAVNNKADAWSMSLGWPHSVNPQRKTWRDICINSVAMGLTPVIAAGNEGGSLQFDNVRTPGDVPEIITVGATDCSDNMASFSSRGPVTWQNVAGYMDWPYPPGKMKPTIAAPGVGTVSTWNNCTGYATLDGTSMATPHVAGAVALMLQANPNLGPWQIKDILKRTAKDLGVAGQDRDSGSGRVDALAAVQAAINEPNVAYPTSFSVLKGTLQGNPPISNLFWREQVAVVVNSKAPFTPASAYAEIEVAGTASMANPSRLDFVYQGPSNGNPVQQRISLYNWTSGSWELVDTRNASTALLSATISITTNPARFIDPGTHAVKARVGYYGSSIAPNWNVQFDQTLWIAYP